MTKVSRTLGAALMIAVVAGTLATAGCVSSSRVRTSNTESVGKQLIDLPMVSYEGIQIARFVVREPEDCVDNVQGLHARRTAAVRYAGGRLCFGGSKSRRDDPTYPQSPAPQLYEVVGRPYRPL